MTIRDLLKSRNMSTYRLAKESNVPYATCNDIVSGKAQLEKCSAETIYKLAHVLQISLEELLAPCFLRRSSFENFKSTICHRVKERGDIDFIIDALESKEILTYYDRKWYPESLYLLAMLNYLSRVNNVPVCDEYDDLRVCKLKKPVYPASLHAMSAASKGENVLQNAVKNAIPEFRRFNIIENEVRNVI